MLYFNEKSTMNELHSVWLYIKRAWWRSCTCINSLFVDLVPGDRLQARHVGPGQLPALLSQVLKGWILTRRGCENTAQQQKKMSISPLGKEILITQIQQQAAPTWWQQAGRGTGAPAHAVEPGCDPLWVGAGKQLCGRLSELQDLGQHGDPLVRVLDAAQKSPGPVSPRIIHILKVCHRLAVLPAVVHVAFVRQRVKDCEKTGMNDH